MYSVRLYVYHLEYLLHLSHVIGPISQKSSLCPTGQVCANHRKGGTKTPAQLHSIDLLPKFRLPVLTKLITEPKEGVQ